LEKGRDLSGKLAETGGNGIVLKSRQSTWKKGGRLQEKTHPGGERNLRIRKERIALPTSARRREVRRIFWGKVETSTKKVGVSCQRRDCDGIRLRGQCPPKRELILRAVRRRKSLRVVNSILFFAGKKRAAAAQDLL